ncbi:MAG: hypothetical protein EXX96DRAFT_564682 [Benjaminiella poitrasii]|nr:MAG: hypothetical protein EXX96DRAFT_564682 [Benjaminiella poitrasii]
MTGSRGNTGSHGLTDDRHHRDNDNYASYNTGLDTNNRGNLTSIGASDAHQHRQPDYGSQGNRGVTGLGGNNQNIANGYNTSGTTGSRGLTGDHLNKDSYGGPTGTITSTGPSSRTHVHDNGNPSYNTGTDTGNSRNVVSSGALDGHHMKDRHDNTGLTDHHHHGKDIYGTTGASGPTGHHHRHHNKHGTTGATGLTRKDSSSSVSSSSSNSSTSSANSAGRHRHHRHSKDKHGATGVTGVTGIAGKNHHHGNDNYGTTRSAGVAGNDNLATYNTGIDPTDTRNVPSTGATRGLQGTGRDDNRLNENHGIAATGLNDTYTSSRNPSDAHRTTAGMPYSNTGDRTHQNITGNDMRGNTTTGGMTGPSGSSAAGAYASPLSGADSTGTTSRIPDATRKEEPSCHSTGERKHDLHGAAATLGDHGASQHNKSNGGTAGATSTVNQGPNSIGDTPTYTVGTNNQRHTGEPKVGGYHPNAVKDTTDEDTNNKPSFGDKVKGNLEKLTGKMTGNEAKVVKGENMASGRT